MLFLPEMCPMYHYYHVLCQQWRNKDVQSINQYFYMKLVQYNECLVSIADTGGLVL